MDELLISGVRFISARRASHITGYAADYLGQLCRAGKLHAKLVGRNWYVSEAAALDHRKRYKRNSENLISGGLKRAEGEFLRYETDQRSLIPDLVRASVPVRDLGREKAEDRGFSKNVSTETEREEQSETKFVPVVVRRGEVPSPSLSKVSRMRQRNVPKRERNYQRATIWGKVATGGLAVFVVAVVWGMGLFLKGVQHYAASGGKPAASRVEWDWQLATPSEVRGQLVEFASQYF